MLSANWLWPMSVEVYHLGAQFKFLLCGQKVKVNDLSSGYELKPKGERTLLKLMKVNYQLPKVLMTDLHFDGSSNSNLGRIVLILTGQ